MAETVRVRFLPYKIDVEVPKGENLLWAAHEAGVHINASCGGGGVWEADFAVIVRPGSGERTATARTAARVR